MAKKLRVGSECTRPQPTPQPPNPPVGLKDYYRYMLLYLQVKEGCENHLVINF